jgi:hypothetical protein
MSGGIDLGITVVLGNQQSYRALRGSVISGLSPTRIEYEKIEVVEVETRLRGEQLQLAIVPSFYTRCPEHTLWQCIT